MIDHAFRALGTEVRIMVAGLEADALARRAQEEIENYDDRLSRFKPDSEICALNADPGERVSASPLLREAVRMGLWAAERSRGLIDPCLLDALERAGYTASLAPTGGRAATGVPAPSGPAAAAHPHPAAFWKQIRVDDRSGVIVRPPGLRIDLGGTGKGHVADRVARLLTGADRWVIDCGGDVRVGGAAQQVVAAHPHGGVAGTFELEEEAVATSSVLARAWTRENGRRAHHLLDPATGEPAWTGIVAATAVGRTTVEAETLAKLAVLSGPDGARGVLAPLGGLFVHADGHVEAI